MDPASGCISDGRSDDTILTRPSVNPVLRESAAADNPYNKMALFLFVLNHRRNRIASNTIIVNN